MITGNFDDNPNYVLKNYICGDMFNVTIPGEYHEQDIGYCFDVIQKYKKNIETTIYED